MADAATVVARTPSSSERVRSESWFTFYLVLEELIAKTIILNLTETRGVLGKILFRGTELIRGSSNAFSVVS